MRTSGVMLINTIQCAAFCSEKDSVVQTGSLWEGGGGAGGGRGVGLGVWRGVSDLQFYGV